ncbi:EAL domain-containing protein [Guyparkeria hydrothermalis]|uniref:bifunctional diguanylate cyclase/phosphodiesterase n=1 Tax=Guyparkeria hydrothermalis TaxID=923 RepID=UPI0020205B57|nr:EAL domain-containing protein [Guyparkeria hydrothermalis]MCL7743744.1 EAL domain-containing protein [Guyparkeria hydrothermalis]
MTMSRLSLRVMIPLGLALIFLLVTTVSLISGIHHRYELLIKESERDALSYTTEVVRILEQGVSERGLLRSQISSIMTDERVQDLFVVGPDKHILMAPDPTLAGLPAKSADMAFDEEIFRRRQRERLPYLDPMDEQHVIEAMQSFQFGTEAAGSQGRGVVCVRFDLTRSLANIRNEAIVSRLPETGAMLLILLLTAWLLNAQVTRPLVRLRRAAQRMRQGNYDVRLPEQGSSEITEVSEGFNAMARAVAKARKKLLASEEQLSVALESIGDGLIATDLDGRVTLMNPVAERLTGWSREQAAGQPIEKIFVICHAGDEQPVPVPIRQVLENGTLVGLANHTVLTDRHGTRYHIADSAAPLKREDGTLMGVVLAFHDVSREYELREALAESEQHFRTLANSGQALIWTADIDGNRDYVNQPWLSFTGMTLEQALNGGWQEAIHPEDLDLLLKAVDHAYHERANFTREYRLRHHSGEYRWLLIKGTPRFNSHGQFVGFIGQCLDITSDKETAAELERLAYHDGLTNLPNRALLLDRVDQAIRRRQRNGGVGALFFVDLDEFKQINDLYGHKRGDQVLIEVARRLTGLVRDTDTVARLGGDEFLVLVPEVADEVDVARQAAVALADKLRHAMEQPFKFHEFQHVASASIGLTLFSGKVDLAEDLLREADIAMYQAKRAGRNNQVNFESGMVEKVTRRYRLEQELNQALSNGEFELHLQTQFDRNERIVGAEVLVRWRHPVRGLVSPAEFVPVAEETGQIVHIGEWVLREACHLLHGLQETEGSDVPPPTLSVNVSPRQFRDPGFADRAREIIQESGIDPARLMIEITENVLVSHASDAIDRMRSLAAIGVRFSIDDFGTGYSSFAYLKRLPLTEIKLDKSFIDDVPNAPGDAAMVEAILAMSNRLGIQVVAEGVETREQVDYLKAHHCDRFQGFYFTHPVPAREWVTRHLEGLAPS